MHNKLYHIKINLCKDLYIYTNVLCIILYNTKEFLGYFLVEISAYCLYNNKLRYLCINKYLLLYRYILHCIKRTYYLHLMKLLEK